MADNRTGLSAADIAESFRDMTGDGSVEWVYTPMHVWVLLDAADMLDENAKLRELLVGAFEDMDAWQKVIAGSNEWGYGKGCLDCLCKLRDAMQELGMEVEVR